MPRSSARTRALLAGLVLLTAAILAFALVGVPRLYDHYYGLRTPDLLLAHDMCVRRDSFGGSADYYQYVAEDCTTGEGGEALSHPLELFDVSDYMFPPMRLVYRMEAGELHLLVVTEYAQNDLEWVFEEDTRTFRRIRGREVGP